MLKILANLIIIILLKEIYSDSDPKYLNLNLNLTIEKGETMTFLVPESYRTKNILVYCSLEDTMEVSYFTSDIKKTRLYIIPSTKFEEERTYKILLKAKKQAYNFQSLFISNDLQVQYGEGDYTFEFEFSTSYQYLTGALIFVDAKKSNKEEMMFFYRQMAGDDIEFLYFPLTNDIDFKSICHSYDYKKNAKTGNLFFPEDDYFILKFVGSSFDIKVQYYNVNSEYNLKYHETLALISNKQIIRNPIVSNEYRYKIDYILGSNENCFVEVKKNNTLLGKLSENNNRLILYVQDLAFVSNNCNAVITIVSNKNNYNIYDIEDTNILDNNLYYNGFTLFRLPRKETNLRAFSFLIHAKYKFTFDYSPCNDFMVGMILAHDIFYERPIYHIYVDKQGDYRNVNFFNPYYFENSFNKFKGDEYFIAFYCDCLWAKASYLQVGFSLFVYKLILKDTNYKVNNKMHEISKGFDPFTNFYQIDSPEKENTILTIRASSCTSYAFRYFVLSDFNKCIYLNYKTYSDFAFLNCEKYIGKESLYVDFENIDDKVLFSYDYVPYNESYRFQLTGLPYEFNITNSLNGKIKVSFYPQLYNEEVKYQLYIVKSDDYFLTLCNFYNIEDLNKEIIDIGTYNINSNSSEANQPINQEIKLNITQNQNLKVGLFFKATYNYKIQNLYYPISFVYEPKYEDENGNENEKNNIILYAVIGISFILIIVIAIFLIRKKMKKTNQIENPEFKGELIDK